MNNDLTDSIQLTCTKDCAHCLTVKNNLKAVLHVKSYSRKQNRFTLKHKAISWLGGDVRASRAASFLGSSTSSIYSFLSPRRSLGRFPCHISWEAERERAHTPSAGSSHPQEAAWRLGCVPGSLHTCPAPLGPEARENTRPSRGGTDEGMEPLGDVGESGVGRGWHKWASWPISPGIHCT